MGPLFAILTAVGYGLHDGAIRRGLRGSSATIAVYLSVFMGLPILVVAAVVSGQLFHIGDISGRSYLFLAISGILDSTLGRYTHYRSLSAIGANRATPVRAIAGPYTLIMAFVLLGERISPINGIGIVIIMIAPALMLSRPGIVLHGAAKSETPTIIPVRRLVEGYTFAVLTALAWGSSPLLIRQAIGDTGLGVVGALIAYSAAAVPLGMSLMLPGRALNVQKMDHGAMTWLVLGGLAIVLAEMARSLALDFSPVTLVHPLNMSAAVFSLCFAFLINRQIESFGPIILAAIALSIVGSVFVVL